MDKVNKEGERKLEKERGERNILYSGGCLFFMLLRWVR